MKAVILAGGFLPDRDAGLIPLDCLDSPFGAREARAA